MASIDESLDEARIIERARLRIKAIGLPKGVDEVKYWFGHASGYIAAALDCGILSNDQWERLLILAEENQESHPPSNGSSGGLTDRLNFLRSTNVLFWSTADS